MRRLPIGIQSFRQIIEGGYVYVDKTAYIHALTADDGKIFFLSRPRRFGKSLFLNTLQEAFSGSRELFQGLHLERSGFDFTAHPVIHLDFSGSSIADPERLRMTMMDQLTEAASSGGVDLKSAEPSIAFRNLIRDLCRKHGRSVVVLVDEYDKPITEHLTNPAIAEANRRELRDFYGVLKGAARDLRLGFLTGVSKFSRMSIFSQLNNLRDITMREPYANICGITETELDENFAEHLAAFYQSWNDRKYPADVDRLRDLIFTWYDGYSWDGATRVFNPFSLLSFLADQEFYPYWFVTGIPQFLMQHLKAHPLDYAEIQGQEITEFFLDSYEIEKAPALSMLFQTGFLTVDSVIAGIPRSYRLRFPNVEVSQSFSRQFLATVAPERAVSLETLAARVQSALDQGRPEDLGDTLTGLFATVPYNLHDGAGEALYHAAFLLVMQFMGLQVIGEVAVAGGEIDATIDRPNGQSYVIEFKYGAGDDDADRLLEKTADKALAQIDRKRYADKYRGTNRTVHKVGVAVVGRGRVLVKANPVAPARE